jgi:hypothetical protein
LQTKTFHRLSLLLLQPVGAGKNRDSPQDGVELLVVGFLHATIKLLLIKLTLSYCILYF